MALNSSPSNVSLLTFSLSPRGRNGTTSRMLSGFVALASRSTTSRPKTKPVLCPLPQITQPNHLHSNINPAFNPLLFSAPAPDSPKVPPYSNEFSSSSLSRALLPGSPCSAMARIDNLLARCRCRGPPLRLMSTITKTFIIFRSIRTPTTKIFRCIVRTCTSSSPLQKKSIQFHQMRYI